MRIFIFLYNFTNTGVIPYLPEVSKATLPANTNPSPSATNTPGCISRLFTLLVPFSALIPGANSIENPILEDFQILIPQERQPDNIHQNS